jgi:hypothetical protein
MDPVSIGLSKLYRAAEFLRKEYINEPRTVEFGLCHPSYNDFAAARILELLFERELADQRLQGALGDLGFAGCSDSDDQFCEHGLRREDCQLHQGFLGGKTPKAILGGKAP